MTSRLPAPKHDPAPIFELFRGQYATQLLVAALADFKVFEHLAAGPQSFAILREQVGLAEHRPEFCSRRYGPWGWWQPIQMANCN